MSTGLLSRDEFKTAVFKRDSERYEEQTGEEAEGYVTRVMDPIPYKNFRSLVAKAVRKDHVNTDEHWMTKKIVPNGINKKVFEKYAP